MLLTRFWILMLAVVAGLSVAAMTLARNSYEHDRAQDAAALLTNDRKVIDQFLRGEARTRIDDLAGVSADAALVTRMEAATRRAGDTPAAIGTAVTDRLRELNQNFGELRGDILLAVDPRGVVVGSVGINVAELGGNLGGLPLVEGAINGYVRDDVWEITGQAYRMAARPVISQGRYYLGAVVHGMVINQAFADKIGQIVPGATVVFFGPDGSYASVTPVAERGARPPPPAPALADRVRALASREDWRDRGVTDAIELPNGEASAVFNALPGMVGAAGGGFAIGRPRPVMPADFLLTASKEDLARVPWGPIAGFAAGAFALGLLFVYVEYDRKKRALHRALVALTKPGVDRLDPLVLGGFARELAVATNDAIDEVVKREMDRSGGKRRNVNDLDALLAPPPPVSVAPPSFPGGPAPAPPSFPGGPAPVAAPSFPGTPAPAAPVPAPAAHRPPPVPPPAPRVPPPPAAMQTGSHPLVTDDDEAPTSIAPIPDGVRAAPQSFTPVAGPMTPDEEMKHWREVFEQFVAKKRECGEPTDAMTFEKFAATLTRHKDQLVAKTKCRAVRFAVTAKDGKATLKATPVR